MGKRWEQVGVKAEEPRLVSKLRVRSAPPLAFTVEDELAQLLLVIDDAEIAVTTIGKMRLEDGARELEFSPPVFLDEKAVVEVLVRASHDVVVEFLVEDIERSLTEAVVDEVSQMKLQIDALIVAARSGGLTPSFMDITKTNIGFSTGCRVCGSSDKDQTAYHVKLLSLTDVTSRTVFFTIATICRSCDVDVAGITSELGSAKAAGS